MNIFINGQSFELSEPETSLQHALALFLTEQQADASFAVAVNGDFVAKPQYSQTSLKAQDSVDVLFPIVGG